MTDKHVHRILIADDEAKIGKSLGRLIRRMGYNYDFVESGREGLGKIKQATSPYALIISDQKMPGMKGAVFLERAMEISPDSMRFLITAYADIQAVTDALNKGAVHQFITKPWDNELLMESIRDAINGHELNIESQRLFRFAKKQNKKLYSLTMALKEKTASHKKQLDQIQNQSDELKAKLETGEKRKNYLAEIERQLNKNNSLNQETLGPMYRDLVAELYYQINDLAARKGFLMPDKYTKVSSD